MSAGPIHIALAFDDAFWAPAYAVMRSVCLNTTRRADLVFHLCHDGLAPHRQPALDRIAAEFGARLHYYPLADNARFNAEYRNLPIARRLHAVTYVRMMLDVLLPADTGRVIYLDCDTQVMAPIEALWQTDLEGRSLAAVRDPWRLHIMNGRDIAEKRDIFDPAASYFNAGVLVIDLARFAAADIPAHIARFAADGLLERLYYDQDMLNLIFRDDWIALDWRWNVIDPREPHQAMNPMILHYTGKARPWHLLAGIFRSVAFAQIYRHVMTNAVFYRFLRERWARYWLGRIGLGGRR